MEKTHYNVKEYAKHVGKSPSTIYRYLGKSMFDNRQRERDGSYTYEFDYLNEMFRANTIKGVRNIQHIYPQKVKSLKKAGFPGISATVDGTIINDKTGEQIEAKPNNNGYLRVQIPHINEKYYVHRLVLLAFDGKPPTKFHQADHLNGIKTDNRIENLQWVTSRVNMGRRDRRLFGNPRSPNKYNSRELATIRSQVIFGQTFSNFLDEFSKLSDPGRISPSTYGRKRKELLENVVIPDWDDIPYKRRLALAVGCMASDDPKKIVETAESYELTFYGEPPLLGEIILFRRWQRYTKWGGMFRKLSKNNVHLFHYVNGTKSSSEDVIKEFWRTFRIAIRNYWHRDEYDRFIECDRCNRGNVRKALLKGEYPDLPPVEGEEDYEHLFPNEELVVS